MPEPVAEADRFEQLDGPRTALARRARQTEHGHLDVFLDGEIREQMERLEDETDFFGPVGGGIVDLGQVATAKAQLPRRGTVEQAEHIEQSRFAAPARADDGNEFAVADAEIDTAQRGNPSVVEFFGQSGRLVEDFSGRRFGCGHRRAYFAPAHCAPTRGSRRLFNRSTKAER